MKQREVTAVIRIKKGDMEILESIAFQRENKSDTMRRILKDYERNGIKREIVKKFFELQEITNKYISPDFHEPLENLKAIFIKSKDQTVEVKAQIAGEITQVLTEKIKELELKYIDDKSVLQNDA